MWVSQPICRYSFNYSIIHKRHVVEQAFSRLKGHWKLMDDKCTLKYPVFARPIAVACCTLYNVCEGTIAHLS